jgi:phosphoenolpyruvate synthase/pyruvate phosphate dikinase
MSHILSPGEISESNRDTVGGKAYALATMIRKGLKIPDFLCVTVEAYKTYVSTTGLLPRILFELNRKNFADMRWEEIWDASLRIRNLFINTPIPLDMRANMARLIQKRFTEVSVVVRSSAPGEDASNISFAGLHESFVNVTGIDRILDHIRLAWSSLWSDRALLYRKELGLDVNSSSMAVVIQEVLLGDRSGVAFTMNPVNSSQSVVESVYGLNQGLVDGTVEPDRWILARDTGKLVSHYASQRDKAMEPSREGITLVELSGEIRTKPPLKPRDVRRVFLMGKRCENLFGSPQDVEFSLRNSSLYTLQSRPITTISSDKTTDLRPWYVSLTRSFENLKMLRTKIEGEILPSMDKDAKDLSSIDIRQLADKDLASEIEKRHLINDKWLKAYDDYCIPFAHGMRLFGQAYNDVIHPSDPYEFMDLLKADKMASLERNRVLGELATLVRDNPGLRKSLKKGLIPKSPGAFRERLNTFHDGFGQSVTKGLQKTSVDRENHLLIPLLLEMAGHPTAKQGRKASSTAVLEKRFFSHFTKEKLHFARELLDLGRASYQLRDDDNIYLGRIEAQEMRALDEGKRRLRARGLSFAQQLESREVMNALEDMHYAPVQPQKKIAAKKQTKVTRVKARQLTGQPAGPGIASGIARVVFGPDDLLQFKSGEILVCDAVDPNMTFIVPIASGIVERRGGMLIHGAIIAREYGLPCVTGIPDVTYLIKTGDRITVDGYLGIVVIG